MRNFDKKRIEKISKRIEKVTGKTPDLAGKKIFRVKKLMVGFFVAALPLSVVIVILIAVYIVVPFSGAQHHTPGGNVETFSVLGIMVLGASYCTLFSVNFFVVVDDTGLTHQNWCRKIYRIPYSKIKKYKYSVAIGDPCIVIYTDKRKFRFYYGSLEDRQAFYFLEGKLKQNVKNVLR